MMYQYSPEEIVQTAVDCKMEAIDWVCSNGWKDPRYLRKISEDAGLTIAAHTILRSAFVQRSKDALDDFKRSLEFACILGAPVMMQPPFPRVEQLSKEDDFNAWKEFYAQTLPLAEACNITLTTEATGVINSPVTTAERSFMVCSLLVMILKRNSESTAEPTVIRITRSARRPKRTTPATVAGASAISTSSIIFRVEIFVRMCGDVDTINLSIRISFTLNLF
jgi:hypothetical protein